jgi:hypothetical protein
MSDHQQVDPVVRALNEGENRYRQTVLGQGPLPGYPIVTGSMRPTCGDVFGPFICTEEPGHVTKHRAPSGDEWGTGAPAGSETDPNG